MLKKKSDALKKAFNEIMKRIVETKKIWEKISMIVSSKWLKQILQQEILV